MKHQTTVLKCLLIPAFFSAVALLQSPLCARGADVAEETVTLDGRSGGRSYEAIGGVSAGASTRLLYDYPEPQRSQILDYMFKPNYGASMEVLKVEIGGDMNSTDGAEPSHMRTPDDLNCDRGYEWWLMEEAKARNPDIILMGLEWGTPGWMKGGFWSDDNIQYILKWLDCAASRGLKIDYMGGWNERKFNADWYVKMSKAVKERYPHTRVIAADDCTDIWRVAYAMSTNAAFYSAVDVVGVHFACGHRSNHERCSSPPVALALEKPLWMSENSSQGHNIGAMPIARALNRMYIDAKLTAYLCWPPVCAWYANLPLADTGIILAAWPWSGHYRIGKSVWVYAHTAQFVQPGWQYLDNSCGYLANGASYVTLKSNQSQDYSVIIEALDASAKQQVRFAPGENLSKAPVHVWSTDLRSDESERHFIYAGTVEPRSGSYAIELEPGHLYTLTTTTGQQKGGARPPSDIAEQMKLPFREDFEGYAPGRLARYFSDMSGGFETAPAGAGRKGMAYRQSTSTAPIAWTPKAEMPPTTLLGDPRWWGDYELACDVLLEEPGYVELLARISSQRGAHTPGYHLRIAHDGAWQVYSQSEQADLPLSSGTVPFSVGKWHKLAFNLKGSQLAVKVDGKTVAKLTHDLHRTGQVGLRTDIARHAQFDNVTVSPTGRPPRMVPGSSITVATTSEHPVQFRGWDHLAANVVDDRPETRWCTKWGDDKDPLPQSITLDLGKSQNTTGLLYWPRLDSADGRITRYETSLSADGSSFEPVSSGAWTPCTATKVASWKGRPARFIRLTALEGVKGVASAAEIKIIKTPVAN